MEIKHSKTFKLIDVVEESSFKDLMETHNVKIKKNLNTLYLIYLLLPILFIFLYLKHKEEIANHTIGNLAIASFYIFPLLLVALTVYILVHINKIAFKTNELGFIFYDKRYFWNEILIVVKLTLSSRRGGDYEGILLGTKSRGIIKLNLDHTNINRDKLIEMIILNRDLVLQKSGYTIKKYELNAFEDPL